MRTTDLERCTKVLIWVSSVLGVNEMKKGPRTENEENISITVHILSSLKQRFRAL